MSNFTFSDYSSSAERELTLLLGKVTHHIHPDVVALIRDENINFRSKFQSFCRSKLELDSFFYPNSDCVFPGFRRPVNFEKTDNWKNNVYEIDGTVLNDNTFPRHIWAFLAMNRPYSGGAGGTWNPSGLSKFELAHIFSHKPDERSVESILFQALDQSIKPYGLFTSASNVVLIPKGFAKPTDSMKSVKACFYKRHIDLYGYNICGAESLDESLIPSWYGEIRWLIPELPNNWKSRIRKLMRYRETYLKRKYG